MRKAWLSAKVRAALKGQRGAWILQVLFTLRTIKGELHLKLKNETHTSPQASVPLAGT